jgi:hypothetical protein
MRRLVRFLMDRADQRLEREDGFPAGFWCEGGDGTALTELNALLLWTPLDKTVELAVVWKHPPAGETQ